MISLRNLSQYCKTKTVRLGLILWWVGALSVHDSHAMFGQFIQNLADQVQREAQRIAPNLENQVRDLVRQQNPEVQQTILDLHSRITAARDTLLHDRNLHRQIDELCSRIEHSIRDFMARNNFQNPNISAGFWRFLNDLTGSNVIPNLLGLDLQSSPVESLNREERIRFREQLVDRVRTNEATSFWNFSENESIMRADVTRHFLESVNRLEVAYPHAIESADASFEQISEMVLNFDNTLLGPNGEWKKSAAVAELNAIRDQFSELGEWNIESRDLDGRSPRQLLNIKQLLGLSWIASNDVQTFNTAELQERQKVYFVMLLAENTRAHNEDSSTGELIYDPAIPNSPSCARGRVIRTLEPLNLNHPAVQLHSHIVEPTPSEISNTLLQFAREYHQQPRPTTEPHDPASAEFRLAIRNHLVHTYPGLRQVQLEASLNDQIVEALLEVIP